MKEKLQSNFKSSDYYWLLLGVGSLLTIIALLPLLDADEQKRLLAEGGLFETLTVYGYVGCPILMWFRWSWQRIIARWYFSVLIILFALRELDYDKAHFTHGLLMSRQYFSDLVNLPELIISILLLIFILTVVMSIFLKERHDFITGVKACKPSEIAIMISLILVVISKSIDGLDRKLAAFGIDLSQSVKQFALVVEEIGEMGIPIMFAIAIISSRKTD